MAVEVAVAFMAAFRAHSVALAAFGGDSAIELLSATVVLVRFRSPGLIAEQLASKITGWLLVALSAYIAAQSLYTFDGCRIETRAELCGNRTTLCCGSSHALACSAQATTRDNVQEFCIAGRCRPE